MAQLREWTRRDFLRAAGIGAAGAALFPFIPTTAAQSASGGIKRLVLFTHPNGSVIHRWRSNGTGAPFVNGGALPALVGPVLSPLERHRTRVSLVDGLDIESGEIPRPGWTERHGAGHDGIAVLWSGARLTYSGHDIEPNHPEFYSMAATIDQLVAAQQQTRVRSLVVGTSSTGKGTYNPLEGICAYAGNSQPIPPEEDPRVVFDLLFSAGVDGTALATQRRRASRQSILSNMKGELSRLRTELPAIDRERLDRHLAGIDDLDRRLGATVSATCMPPARPGANNGDRGSTAEEVLNRLRLQVDVVKHAFACDLTRVANILIGSEGGTPYWVPISELPQDPRNGDMHGASHETYISTDETWRRVMVEVMSRLQRGAAEEFARIIDALDEGPGPTLLDETLAVWGTAMGWGGPHTNWSVPFVLASKHPRFAGGKYHRFGNYDLNIETSFPSNPWNGPSIRTPHNRLLTSIMHLMGRTDVQAVGDPGINGQQGGRDLDNTPISGLFA